uniref:Amino acid transporter n=1 Tax=Drosophila melanogaster TaxID=7227 RepID=Q8T0S9_DROME
MEMEKSGKFSDYLFAKMGPPTSTELPPKTTECSDAPVELTGYRRWLSENLMLLVTLSGVLLGVILGLSLRPLNLHGDSIMLISYPGELFMRVLKLMILPLVISSLIAGSASLNAKMNGKIALRTLVYFASTSFFNAALGIALVLLIHPGNPDLHNADDRSTDRRAVNLLDSLLDLGRNVFPDNLFQASIQQAHTVYLPKPSILHVFNETMNDTLASGSEAQRLSEDLTEDVVLVRDIQYRSGTNTLGIVFFCLVFGTFLGTIGQKGQVVVDFFAAIFERRCPAHYIPLHERETQGGSADHAICPSNRMQHQHGRNGPIYRSGIDIHCPDERHGSGIWRAPYGPSDLHGCLHELGQRSECCPGTPSRGADRH